MFAWANDLIRADDAKRSVVIASMNMFSIAIYMWWSIVFYNATQAPSNWREGNWAMVAMGLFLMVTTITTFLLQKRQEKQEREEGREGRTGGDLAVKELELEGERKV